MAHSIATRNTCFALISAIEDDVRRLITIFAEAHQLLDLLPGELREIAAARMKRDQGASEVASSDLDLLHYCDFGDLAALLSARVAPLVPQEAHWLRSVATALQALAPARNRVCHTRPLEADDLPRLLDFATELVASPQRTVFTSCAYTLERLNDDPSFTLTLTIPTFWSNDSSTVHNNLPLPEFDETGFLGRAADRNQVGKHLRSHYPVITIVGEGGIGKTALALRCLYDLLDDSARPFEAIVWTSLKGSVLTPAGVREISNAITTTLGLLTSISDSLGLQADVDATVDERLDELIEFLAEFRVLLAIDNLETVGSSHLRPLLERLPAKSKVLITSRVGVGEFEVRYALGPLDPATAVILLRSTARALSVQELARGDDGYLKRLCARLYHNPLLIKWFVASVGRGATPAGLLNHRGERFEEALSFCFENLFDRMEAAELSVIETLACARRPLSVAELLFLSGQPDRIQVEKALGLLHNSSVVNRLYAAGNTLVFQLSEPALGYISSRRPPAQRTFAMVQDRLRELRTMVEREAVAQARHRYDIFSVRTGSTKDERISAVYLRRAMDALHSGDLNAARLGVAEAKQLAPDNAEAWRVSAVVESSAGDPYRAIEELEHSIGLNPSSAIARYTYAQITLRHDGDYEAGLQHISVALKQDSHDPAIQGMLAMLLVRVGQYGDAAAIYDRLIASAEGRSRKVRISTRDQAAECYRRWAENDQYNNDTAAFKAHISKAVSILKDSQAIGEFDLQSEVRLSKVLGEVFERRLDLVDQEFLESLLYVLEDMKAATKSAVLPCDRVERFIAAERHFPTLAPRLRAVFSPKPILKTLSPQVGRASSAQANRESDRTGSVISMPSGVSYGFIEDLDGRRWFFHSSTVNPRHDWGKLSTGTIVTFRIGVNVQGDCAVDVRIAPR